MNWWIFEVGVRWERSFLSYLCQREIFHQNWFFWICFLWIQANNDRVDWQRFSALIILNRFYLFRLLWSWRCWRFGDLPSLSCLNLLMIMILRLFLIRNYRISNGFIFFAKVFITNVLNRNSSITIARNHSECILVNERKVS